MNLPSNRKYTESNLWLKSKGEIYSVGILESVTEIAEKFIFLDLPDEGEVIEEDDLLMEYESLKRVGEFKLPGRAEILEVNTEAGENPEKIMKNPNDTWLVKIQPLQEFKNELLSKNEAEEYYEEQM